MYLKTVIVDMHNNDLKLTHKKSQIAHKLYLSGAFLKTQRHNNIGHKDTNVCLFNPKLTLFYVFFVIKTQICTTSPPHCTNCAPAHL